MKNKKINIVIDDKIPYIQGILEPYACVTYLSGNQITAEDIKHADALLVRTRTQCNAALLHNSKVQFIASATIGYDHIDTLYCEQNQISWHNAPGSNASSVEQYVITAILGYAEEKGWNLQEKTIGVVGVGHVGSKVAQACQHMGMKVLLNDPPLQRTGVNQPWENIKTIQEQADIITFHVPLNRQGKDTTFHLVDQDFIADLKKVPLLINTCRGEVFDTEAVKKALSHLSVCDCIVDCWENEPEIDLEYLHRCYYGTPHIAGYSRDGKANATKMILQALATHFRLPLTVKDWTPQIEIVNTQHTFDCANLRLQAIINKAVQSTYDITKDHCALLADPASFEQLRANYPARRDFSKHEFTLRDACPRTKEVLRCLNFKIQSQ